MLKKRNRLSRREFAYLLKHGRRVYGRDMTLVYFVPKKTQVTASNHSDARSCELKGVSDETPPLDCHVAPLRSAPSTTAEATADRRDDERFGSTQVPTNYKLQITNSPALRAGVVVSKKTARRASARNKLRRNIYALLGDMLSGKQDLLVAVLTRPAAAALTKEVFADELTTLVRRMLNTK